MTHKKTALRGLIISFLALSPALAAKAPLHGQVGENVHALVEVAGASHPGNITQSDWSALRDIVESERHSFIKTDTGFEATNHRFGWRAEFDGQSALITPDHGDWSFGLALTGFGFQGEIKGVDASQCSACVEGGRLSYSWSETLSEWWINDRNGLEHGFTVNARPARSKAEVEAPLVFSLDTPGSLAPDVNDSGTGLLLSNGAGELVLRYSGLIAYDANGASLEAWLEVNGGEVRICVQESLAEYPIVVDPTFREAYIKASNPETLDFFGSSVAVSGDTIVVGASGEDSDANTINGNQSNNDAQHAGAVYVFHRVGSTWTQQAYLKASNSDVNDRFGGSVAISGNTIVVGARQESSNATGIDGDQANNGADTAGAAYVFQRVGSTWVQQAYLKASNSESGDLFGISVSISGDTIVVGAMREDSDTTTINGNQSNNGLNASGAAYIFHRFGATWQQQAYLKADNCGYGDNFGYSVSVSGHTIVVGAPRERSIANTVNGDGTDDTLTNSGAAYVFQRSGITWTQQAYLKASNSGYADEFGAAVAISGDTIVVGSRNEDSSANTIDGNGDDNTGAESGAAYIFERSGSNWTQGAYLKASNSGRTDKFGGAVAVSGNMVVVGATWESSNATGIGGDQSDNSVSQAGSAYVFVRSLTGWIQEEYLKAYNTDAVQSFGQGVAVSDGLIAVSAPGESSGASGIDGDGSDTSERAAGAVYAYLNADTGIGVKYCDAALNSSGQAGAIAASGSVNVAHNDVTLTALDLPVGQFGIYIVSTQMAFVPTAGGTSNGNLCLGGTIGRYNQPSQILATGPNGAFSLILDLTSIPSGGTTISAMTGSQFNFQAWFRDGVGLGSNFTDAVSIDF